MTRNQFVAALAGAPIAAAAKPTLGPCVQPVEVSCDTGAFISALDQLTKDLSSRSVPLIREDCISRAQALPPIVVRVNGKEIGRVYPFA